MEVLIGMLNVALIVATLRTTAPILLVALGGTFTTKAGIFNIGLEGQMLAGAFFAVLGSIWTGSAWGGVLCGVAAALVFAYVFALLVVTFRANEVVVGLALNILAGGMTISLMKAIFGTRGSIVGQGIVGLPKVQIPYARDILGSWAPLVSGYTPLVYVAFIAVPLLRAFLQAHASRPLYPCRRREARGSGSARHLHHTRPLHCLAVLRGAWQALPARTFRSATSPCSPRTCRPAAASWRWRS